MQQLAERNKKSTLQTTKLCAKLDEKKEQLHIDITASKDMESVVGHAIIGTNYKGLICITRTEEIHGMDISILCFGRGRLLEQPFLSIVVRIGVKDWRNWLS